MTPEQRDSLISALQGCDESQLQGVVVVFSQLMPPGVPVVSVLGDTVPIITLSSILAELVKENTEQNGQEVVH